MINLIITTTTPKTVIELIDTDRIGNDVEFLYATPSMKEDDPALKIRIASYVLLDFISEYELNETSQEDDAFLLDVWEEVKDMYWDRVLNPELVISYVEAMAYVESFKASHSQPMTAADKRFMLKRVKDNYGFNFLREAV